MVQVVTAPPAPSSKPMLLIVQIGVDCFPIAIDDGEVPVLLAFLAGLQTDDRRRQAVGRIQACWTHYKRLPRDPALLPGQTTRYRLPTKGSDASS